MSPLLASFASEPSEVAPMHASVLVLLNTYIHTYVPTYLVPTWQQVIKRRKPTKAEAQDLACGLSLALVDAGFFSHRPHG